MNTFNGVEQQAYFVRASTEHHSVLSLLQLTNYLPGMPHFFLANMATNPIAPITVAPPRAINPMPMNPPVNTNRANHSALFGGK